MGQTVYVNNLLALFDETFRTPAGEPQGSIYLDRGTSWEDSLRDLSAADASRPAFAEATTIAAHVAHTIYYVEVLQEYMKGGTPVTDWPGSWKATEVSDSEWDALRARLFDTCTAVRHSIEEESAWDDNKTGGAMAIVVHSAYHLGAVRQLLKAGRSRPGSAAG
jgi:hypothetical protein